MSEIMKKIPVILSGAMILSLVLTSAGVAYAGGVRGAGLAGVSFLLTLCVILVLGQVIPAGILLSTLIAASFSSARRGELPIRLN
jgi:hypothetical protein